MLMTLFNRFPERFEVDGVLLPLRQMPLDRRSKRRILRGGYETAERKLVGHFVQEGDQVLEFGASLGVVSSILAKRVGVRGRVIALEPDERLRPAFDFQMEVNQLQVKCICALGCPIWSKCVPAEWKAKSFTNQGHSLSGRAESSSGSRRTGDSHWKTAFEICRDEGFEPNVLIVDIEGAETVWCEHAPEFPAHVDRLIVEFHPEINGERMAAQAVQAVINEGFKIVGFSRTVLAFQRGAPA
jgi:FkbM family methyltransferase